MPPSNAGCASAVPGTVSCTYPARPVNDAASKAHDAGVRPASATTGTSQIAYHGSGDVQKTEDGWNVEIPVPGYKPDQIDVTVEDRVLTVTGKTERRSFQRSILLPEDVDAEAIDAKVEHGMLTLALRLHPKAQPRKIEVKVVN